jgi:hypothetical protein
MDPYLEYHWGDVHHRLVVYACDQLQARLPRDLRARVEERLTVESSFGLVRPILPDVRIFAGSRKKVRPASSPAASAVAEPLLVSRDEPATEGFIEIREVTAGKKLVTVIEVLSPPNKAAGEAQLKYLEKREELYRAQVSLVEIDLLRAGRPLLAFAYDRLAPALRTPYRVVVSRGWELLRVEYYPVPLRERLPIIAIPLRRTDSDVPLDLQALVEECYQKGAYNEDFDYAVDPELPFDKADARWVDDLLRGKGLRPRRNGRQAKRSRGRKRP